VYSVEENPSYACKAPLTTGRKPERTTKNIRSFFKRNLLRERTDGHANNFHIIPEPERVVNVYIILFLKRG